MDNYTELVERFEVKIAQYQNAGKKLFATSSFQTQSIVLLHLISKHASTIPIYFLNTGYHFPQTIEYKQELTRLLGLHVIDLQPSISKFQQRNAKGELLYISDPDRCCYYNKIQPMESVLKDYDVWISGVRRDQTVVRQEMAEEEPGKYDTLRYHPMLDWMPEMVNLYIELFNLPRHPLAPDISDSSIGCEPCTSLVLIDENDTSSRQRRWSGLKKSECGLHTELRGEK